MLGFNPETSEVSAKCRHLGPTFSPCWNQWMLEQFTGSGLKTIIVIGLSAGREVCLLETELFMETVRTLWFDCLGSVRVCCVCFIGLHSFFSY